MNDLWVQVNNVRLKPRQHLTTVLATDPFVDPIRVFRELRAFLPTAPDGGYAVTDKNDRRGRRDWLCHLSSCDCRAESTDGNGCHIQNDKRTVQTCFRASCSNRV